MARLIWVLTASENRRDAYVTPAWGFDYLRDNGMARKV
jgi:hypothetical protein